MYLPSPPMTCTMRPRRSILRRDVTFRRHCPAGAGASSAARRTLRRKWPGWSPCWSISRRIRARNSCAKRWRQPSGPALLPVLAPSSMPVPPSQGPSEPVPAGADSRAAALPPRFSSDLVRRAVWRAAALLLCAAAESASAQLSGTLAGVTDYRYRGVTFSDRRPAAQAGLTYDDASGWYAGAFGSTVRLDPPGGASSKFQAIAYAGYAMRLGSGVSLEVGGDYAAFAGASGLN